MLDDGVGGVAGLDAANSSDNLTELIPSALCPPLEGVSRLIELCFCHMRTESLL
jgi:hypothetical protein